MSPPRVLFVGPNVSAPPEAGSEADAFMAEAVATMQQALDRLATIGCSAVVCWAERQDELAAVIRLRKAAPETPILLVTPQAEPEFATLARQLGATRVERAGGSSAETASLIRKALVSGELTREFEARRLRNRALTQEILDLSRKNLALARSVKSQLRGTPRLAFTPLVVEGDPNLAIRTLIALQRADIFAPLPVLKSQDEAIAFLTHLAAPGMEGLRVQPSIFLLDWDLPDQGGLGILKWIRSQAPFSQLPVIAFGSLDDAGTISTAYEHGANSYILKCDTIEAEVRCLASLKTYWGSYNQGTRPF